MQNIAPFLQPPFRFSDGGEKYCAVTTSTALPRNKMAAGDESRFREKKINLAALRKLDPYAGSILDTASSVAHYKFDPATEKWVSYLK